MSNIDKQLHKIAIDIQQSIEDSQDEHRLITDGGIINIISEFGLGETEFHTADIERLVCQKQLLEKEYKKLFDMFYVESTKNDLQAEKIIECKAQIATLLADKFELQKQRDELLDCLISVIPIGEMKTFDEIDRNYKSAKELIKKYKS